MTFDPISVIEACYAHEADDSRWLESIVAPLSPSLGVFGLTFDARDSSLRRPLVMTGARIPQDALRILVGKFMKRPARVNRVIYRPVSPVELVSRMLQDMTPADAERELSFLSKFGCSDCVGVFGIDSDRQGLALVIPVKKGSPPPGPRTRGFLSRVSAHLTSALRLRRATVNTPVSPGDGATEAIADPGGKILHAAGDARSRRARAAITAAVRLKDRAQGRLRRADPEEAAELWQGLLDGSWSLVDHVESDGRRRVLVRKNAPGVPDPKALTPRERAVRSDGPIEQVRRLPARPHVIDGVGAPGVGTAQARLSHSCRLRPRPRADGAGRREQRAEGRGTGGTRP